MIRKLVAHLARRTTQLQVQVALATLYGLISIFGHIKTGLIIYKLIKTQRTKVRTVKNHVPPTV